MPDVASLILPSFIAGLLMFLAPCTLPLVPGYLGFISGVSLDDFKDPTKARAARWRVFKNGVFYVLGFSFVFIVLGSLFGLGGAALIQYRVWLSRIGGIFVIFFGLYMMKVLKIPVLDQWMSSEHRLPAGMKHLTPGKPTSSFVFGATFAFGWTPCVGPVLGSVLLLASTSATVGQGAFLLTVFSLGLAIPFLAVALGLGWASQHLQSLNRYLNFISIVGGIFLVFLGILLVFDKFAVWLGWAYQAFSVLNLDIIYNYL